MWKVASAAKKSVMAVDKRMFSTTMKTNWDKKVKDITK